MFDGKIKKWLAVASILMVASANVHAQLPQDICEEQVPANWMAHNGSLQMSSQHFKSGRESVQWQWHRKSAVLTIKDTTFSAAAKDPRSCFVFWVYNETPVNDALSFEFGDDKKVYTQFRFQLNFKGWRTAWVMYHRDMTGAPDIAMNRLRIVAPASLASGKLYLDQLLYNQIINPRSPMQDVQAPFVNKGVEKKANAHWNALYVFSKTPYNQPLPKSITAKDRKDIQVISGRVLASIQKADKKGVSFEAIKREYESWQIQRHGKQITGNPVYSMNDAELVPGSVNGKNVKVPFEVKTYTQLMYRVALAYHQASLPEQKAQLEKWFINLLDHMDDQGWAYGSGMGALHHLGYNFDGYYNSCLLMKDVIKKHGQLQRTWNTMYWFSGLGRTQERLDKLPSSNIDVFNTLLNGMLASILLLDDNPFKVRQLQIFSKWLSANVVPNYAIEGAFKPDGAVFHHGTLYPAYATGGFKGLAPVLYYLSNTSFRLTTQAHQSLQHAMYKMHLYTNPTHWPVSVSGRHPTGNFSIPPDAYAYMVRAGMPGRNSLPDTLMNNAYLRIVQKQNDPLVKQLFAQGFGVTAYPAGHWNMNYGLFDMHRRQNWLLTIKGHNRYIVANESYPNANVFGRYVSYGQLELLYPEQSSYPESNFSDTGWDWNALPGTTTIHYPVDQLRENIINPDDFSGVEEMLLSDEIFAGGTALKGQGLFAMKLHGPDKYDMGSFRAIKSWFMFDSLVIALGSNISSAIQEYPAQTNIFQNFNPRHTPLSVNGSIENRFPFADTIQSTQPISITDNRNIQYYIPGNQRLILSTTLQHSRDQKDLRNTEGVFSKLVIDHGRSPRNKGYEYAMLIDTSVKINTTSFNPSTAYRVLQKDSMAHRVYYAPLSMTGIAAFGHQQTLADSLVGFNSQPCLILYQKENNAVELSVTDPDLAFYKGPDDSPVVDGKRKEVSIYSRTWYNAPSQPSVITLHIKGGWALNEKREDVHLRSLPNDNTEIRINCRYGLANTLRLIKKMK